MPLWGDFGHIAVEWQVRCSEMTAGRPQGGHKDAFRSTLGPLGGHFGTLLAHFKALWGHLGGTLKHFGSLWYHFWVYESYFGATFSYFQKIPIFPNEFERFHITICSTSCYLGGILE